MRTTNTRRTPDAARVLLFLFLIDGQPSAGYVLLPPGGWSSGWRPWSFCLHENLFAWSLVSTRIYLCEAMHIYDSAWLRFYLYFPWGSVVKDHVPMAHTDLLVWSSVCLWFCLHEVLFVKLRIMFSLTIWFSGSVVEKQSLSCRVRWNKE